MRSSPAFKDGKSLKELFDRQTMAKNQPLMAKNQPQLHFNAGHPAAEFIENESRAPSITDNILTGTHNRTQTHIPEEDIRADVET